MAAGTFPGAVVYVRQDNRVVWHHAFGWAAVTPRRRTMRSDAVFDLASLTKPIATATAVLQLVERGIFQLDHPVADYLPPFAASGKQAVTVRHLLTHTSGLPAWIRLYLRVRTPAEALRYICALSLGMPGSSPQPRRSGASGRSCWTSEPLPTVRCSPAGPWPRRRATRLGSWRRPAG